MHKIMSEKYFVDFKPSEMHNLRIVSRNCRPVGVLY